jgi:hypothetical protein
MSSSAALAAALHVSRNRIVDWRNADRSSAGLLSLPCHKRPVLCVSSRRGRVRWRGIVATHSWIVLKSAGAASYSRFDYTAWGEPIWIDRFILDGRWFGRMPELVFAADGTERMIPLIRQAVRDYAYPTTVTIAFGPDQTLTPSSPRSLPRRECARHLPQLLSARTLRLIADGLGSLRNRHSL